MNHDDTVLNSARVQALEVRALYEHLENRINGKTWTMHELMLGFSNDVGYIGRLLLAHDGTWPIDGDVNDELRHKLAESIWWSIVVAEKLGIDISDAFNGTMNSIHSDLSSTIQRLEAETDVPAKSESN